MNNPSNESVLTAFSQFKESLTFTGFQQEFNTYYRCGHYETGPTVVITSTSISLNLLPEKVEGRNFWRFSYETPSAVQLPGHQGSWRLLFFGLEGFPAGFSGNREAVEWFKRMTR